MGAYLAKPKTEKISESDESGKVSYAASCMQGWRVTMEDAHSCMLDFDNSATLFAVYDGHGGAEVAKYVAKHLPEVLKDTESYKKGEFKQSMIESFLKMDQLILSDEGLAELKEIAGFDKDGEEEDLGLLEQEAAMPLHELLAKMKEMKKKLGDDEEDVEYWTEKNEKTANNDDKETSNDKEPSVDTPRENGTKNGKEEKVNENGSENGEGSSSSNINCTNEKESDDKKKNTDAESDSKKDEKPLREEAGPSQAGKVDGNNKDEEKITDAEDDDDDEEEEEEDDEEDSEDDDDDDDDDNNEDEQDGIENVGFQSSDEVGYDSGTTAIVALVHGNQLTVGNVGDSRCVLCRNGIALEMSIDHKPEDEHELNRIHKAGGKVTCEGRVNGGLNLSRALGDHSYKLQTELGAHEQQITAVPDVKQAQLTEADEFMVIACDGIWNVKGSQEVVDFVSDRLREQKKNNQIELSKICEELLDSCLAPDTTGDGSGCDNMTAVIVLFNNETSTTEHNNKKRKQTDIPDGADTADKRIKTDDS